MRSERWQGVSGKIFFEIEYKDCEKIKLHWIDSEMLQITI